MASNQMLKIAKGKLWKFFGGIKPATLKSTSAAPISELSIPSLITLPLDRHLGPGGIILVKIGDQVKRGQQLTVPKGKRLVPIHASTSGTVVSISKEILPHPSGYSGLCITIKPDGKDESVMPKPIANWENVSPEELLSRIRDFGVEGLGGGVYPTEAKLRSALEESQDGCNIFIANGCECEPILTCDDRLMQEKADDIIQGLRIIQHIVKPKMTMIAIENDKPEAIAAMKVAVDRAKEFGFEGEVREIPAKYPSGSARSLIKILTGIEVPYDTHTSECGIIVNNVGTIYSVKQAVVDGYPITSRIVTIAGKSLRDNGNAVVRFGTSVRFVLNQFHLSPEFHQRIILGGPMMGFTLPSIDVPITKAATCIMAPSSEQIPLSPDPKNCIRCGRCARVCPSRLVPYKMYAVSRAKDHGQARKCGIMDCTECGSCSFVCPSHINLTIQFRKEKAIQKMIRENEYRNARAKERREDKEERLQKEAAERALKKAAALERIKAKQEAEKNLSPEEIARNRQDEIARARAEAIKRKAAKKLEIDKQIREHELQKKKDEHPDQIEINEYNTVDSLQPEFASNYEVEQNTIQSSLDDQELQEIDLKTESDLISAATPKVDKNEAPVTLKRTAARKVLRTINAWDYYEESGAEKSKKLVGEAFIEVTEDEKPKTEITYSNNSPKEDQKDKIPEGLKKHSLRTRH